MLDDKSNKTLWERALQRRGCGINSECGGIVRNHIFSGYPSAPCPYKYRYFSPLSNRRLNLFTGSLLVRGVIFANILFQILLWRTCMLLLFIEFLVSIIISVRNKLRTTRSQLDFFYFLYNHTFFMYSELHTFSATWLTSVNSLTKPQVNQAQYLCHGFHITWVNAENIWGEVKV